MSGDEGPTGGDEIEPSGAPWRDPDDSPEWTDEMFDRADVHQGDRLIRRGRRPEDDEARPERA